MFALALTACAATRYNWVYLTDVGQRVAEGELFRQNLAGKLQKEFGFVQVPDYAASGVIMLFRQRDKLVGFNLSADLSIKEAKLRVGVGGPPKADQQQFVRKVMDFIHAELKAADFGEVQIEVHSTPLA